MNPLFLLGLVGSGVMVLASGKKKVAAAPVVDAVTGDSGTNWFVETIIPRGQSVDGTATVKVYDLRMAPILTYEANEDKRSLVHTHPGAGSPQIQLALRDFGIVK